MEDSSTLTNLDRNPSFPFTPYAVRMIGGHIVMAVLLACTFII